MTSLLLLAAVQAWPVTKAEASGCQATSSFEESVSFMRTLQAMGGPLRLEILGRTAERRPIVVAVVSDPPVRTAEEARRQGKLVTYIQASIHAGEVEGKESALKLLRTISQDHAAGKKGLLARMVLLVNPVYNADGNEKWAPAVKVRTEQDGPLLVGQRENAQGLDLNRDAVKAASPEMRAALAGIYTKWDPDLVMDLHTTDGTRHGFDLTWSPPTNPNTPSAVRSYAQDVLMPRVRRRLKEAWGMETFDYGNAAVRDGKTVWETFGHEGRYVTNYAGLRGSIGILSEAASYIPFEDRIRATDRFVGAVLAAVAEDSARIRRIRSPLGPSRFFGVEFRAQAGRRDVVPLEKLAPGEPRPLIGRPREVNRVEMPVYDRFESVRAVAVPQAYLVPGDEAKVLDLLRRHGIGMTRLTRPEKLKVEAFVITERTEADRPYQGVRLISLKGRYEARAVTRGPGDWLVPSGQRLGALASHILEPESDDGATTWGFFRDSLTREHPVLRVLWGEGRR